MHELALRRSTIALSKHADTIADARPAELRDTQADFDVLRKLERCKISAARFDNQGDRIARPNVEHALLDHPRVHRAVEPLVEDRVVNVSVGVIVGPACRESAPDPELAFLSRLFAAHQAAS